jgi:catechol 2,3-dioxygenase-like lactoylglutathione lyase family enzyme
MRLDHVALATRDVTEPLGLLVGRLGATVISGGEFIGFRPMQVFVGDDAGGMKIELLEPWDVERNDFLERFLTRHGDGAHHLTFKVDDLEATLDRVTDAGFAAVGVDLSQPEWREAFLLPRDAQGTVVQLADSSMSVGHPVDEYRMARERGLMMEPRWWPEPPARAPVAVRLRRVVLRCADLDAARALFVDLLEGSPVSEADDRLDAGRDGGRERRVELEWPGGGRLLLEHAPGEQPGIDRLEMEGAPDDVIICGVRCAVRTPTS